MSSSTSPDNAGNDTVSTGMADSPPNANGGGGGGNDGDASGVPKPKRLACMICRKRKLKCDGSKPSCSTCTRLGHSCAYDEVRRKSGPKRGYVKALEERLKQVETLLKTQEPGSSTAAADLAKQMNIGVNGGSSSNAQAAASANFNVTNPSINIASDRDMDRWHFNGESPQAPAIDDFNFQTNISMGMANVDANFTWEMIGLGLEEPLPTQEVIDELHQIFFEKVHPSVPMIHKYRYLAAMNLAPNQRPPVALRYAIWTLASAITEKFQDMKDLFYQRARKYVEADYIKGYGEHMISVAHAQTHVLLASYEFKMMYFPRAWMNTGAAVRLCQMIGLHRLDGAGLDVKQCLPAPRDWTEREERRRTFWMAFCEDRYASIGTGWPMTIDEKDILTNLPSSEEAFDMSRPEQTQTLQECMNPAGASKLSSFGGIVLLACLFGRNLTHLHRPDVDDRDNDLNGEFWKRHRNMDNILLNTSLCLPSHLKLPVGLNNPNIVFTNMCIHTSTICLHQAAIFKADKNRLPASVSAESKVRCITAANEIASIMRMISHMDLSTMNPFISFCLYVSARVFVQYLKSRPEDSQTADSLRFLLSAMNALKRRNPLTESFLVQLDVDLEALGMRIPQLKSAFPRSGDSPTPRSTGMPKMMHPDLHSEGNTGYRNECAFMKLGEDDGNPTTAPDLVDPEPGSAAAQMRANSDAAASSSSWLGAEQSLPTRERSAGPQIPLTGIPFHSGSSSMFDKSPVPTPGVPAAAGVSVGTPNGPMGFVQSDASGDNELSPDNGLSNRPTPQSSTASEQHAGNRQGGSVGGGSASNNNNNGSGSGSNRGPGSFEASPVASHQNLGNAAGPQADLDRSAGVVAGSAAAAAAGPYFNDPTFGMSSTGLTPDPRFMAADGSGDGFAIPQGWESLANGQTGMTPVTEGVLRSLMNMSPMDSMDLGWS